MIPNSVMVVCGDAFSNCYSLTSIKVELENTYYDSRNDCNAIIHKSDNTLVSGCKNTVIPNGITNIGNNAFEGCNGLTSIIIPNSVTSIGTNAFSGCSNLTSITLSNNATSIGYGTFEGCSSLTSITIPNSMVNIGQRAFSGCSGLTSITLSDNITSIDYGTFEGCSSLTSITIPNSVVNIGKYAFAECSDLTSVILPNSITSIESAAFYRCASINSIAIPNSVTSIGDFAFEGCISLSSLKLSDGVSSIGKFAFGDCIGLTSIIIPKSVKNINNYAFLRCSDLKTVTIEANKNLEIGSKVFSYCNLEKLIMFGETIPKYTSDDFADGLYETITLYVPSALYSEYCSTSPWNKFKNIMKYSINLTDGETFANEKLRIGQDISYTRTFNNTAWQSLYIPFSLNYNDWKDDFEVAYINGIRQWDYDDNGTIDETIMDVIKIKSGSTTPNMPYLIKAKTTGEKTFSVSDATLYPAEENSVDCSTTIAKYTFTGTYNTIPSATMIANNYYGMGGGELVHSDGSNDLMPYRWYMKVESRNPSYNASNAAKTITINVVGDEEEETTTGVKELQITNYLFTILMAEW